MIRVAANLSWLVPGRVGGSEEYATRLLRSVIRVGPPDVELRIVGSRALRDAHPELAAVRFDAIGGPMRVRPYRAVVESTGVYRATRRAEVVHHFGGRVPARHQGNEVVTIHDLQPLHHPENFSALKRRYLQWALPRSVAAARAVLVPSEWVAATVVDELDADPHKVIPVPSTWDDEVSVDLSLADSLGAGPVVVYPAVSHPHKNHVLLLDAVDRLVDAWPDLTLVLTGGRGSAEGAVTGRVARARVRVVRPGRVPAPVMRGLMARADVVAFPSAYEGFGLPVLEAMQGATPVVAADRTALPEVLGDAGRLVADMTPEAWAAALGETLGGAGPDPSIGVARAARYSPETAAERLIEVWRSIGRRSSTFRAWL